MKAKTKTKLVVLNPFPVYPPVSGGQGRVFHLYKHLAQYFDVVIICLSDRRSYNTLSPELVQLAVPKSLSYRRLELEVFREIGYPTCAIIPKAASLIPEYDYVVERQSKDASIIILSHPYLYRSVQHLKTTRVVGYDAHNVEYELNRQILPAHQSDLLDEIQRAEKAACEQSHFIAPCSQQDANILNQLYNIPDEKFIVVPNGADTSRVPFISPAQRQYNKAAQQITQPWVLYMGSSFPPNLQAARQVIEIAKQMPDVNFLLMGTLCEAFLSTQVPGNIELRGLITEVEKYNLFSLTDIALNPVQSGSGTNLKMTEYMAAGLPIITTPIGARGISEENGRYFVISEYPEMPARIRALLGNLTQATYLAHEAYGLVRCHFDWNHIATDFAHKLSALL